MQFLRSNMEVDCFIFIKTSIIKMLGDRYENGMAPPGSRPQLKTIEQLHHPFNKLVKVAVVDDDGQEICYGTGTLLIDCYVLTSLHVITRKVKTKYGEYKEEEPRPTVLSAQNIKVFIGQNGENSPGIQCNVLNLAYPEEYLQAQANSKFLYDFAILKIDLTHSNLEDNSLKLSIPAINKFYGKVQLYGYDKNYNQIYSTRKERERRIYRLYGCKTDLLKIDEFTIKYKMPTNGGKAGAPLISYSDQGKYNIIGIHTGTFTKTDTDFALRITEEVIAKITQLIKQLDQDTRVQRRNIEDQSMTNQIIGYDVVSPPREEGSRPERAIKEIRVNRTALKEINDLCPWINTEQRKTVKTLALDFWNSQVRLQDFFDIKLLLRFDNIKNLSLNHCQLKQIPNLSQLHSLKRVDCSNNYISQIDNLYTPNISHIFLNYNSVREISEKIIEAQSLDTLQIRYNRRALRVDDNVAQLLHLRQLRLDGAPELIISSEVIEKLQDKETLEMFDY